MRIAAEAAPTGRMAQLLLICAGLLSGCSPAPEPDNFQYTIIALGTVVKIELITADEQRAVQARDELDALLTEIEHDWYAFGDGELGRVNAALASGSSVQTTPELSALIERSLTYRKMSDGLFEPIIADLVELWGFADFDVQTKTPTPPSDIAVNTWRDRLAARHNVSVSAQTISTTGPVSIDLGGVAKGTILARAATLLEQLGIDSAMIDAGGDLRVLGSRGRRPWRVGIRNPLANNMIATVELQPGEAIVSSGNYERYFDHDGRRYNHVLDPRTGRPVENSAGVTVIDVDPELADAAATALMVAGPDRFDEITARMGITAALIVGVDGELRMTPTMARRIMPATPP